MDLVRSLSEPGLDARDIEIITDVRDNGWHVVRVAEEDGAPGYAHSIGLCHNFSHPEVVVFGLSDDVLAGVIDDIGDDVRSGQRFLPGSVHGGLLEGVECLFKPVHRRWYAPFLSDCDWFYCGGSFPVVQCVWPDRAGRFPWDVGFDDEWKSLQPLLFREHPEAARATTLLAALERDE